MLIKQSTSLEVAEWAAGLGRARAGPGAIPERQEGGGRQLGPAGLAAAQRLRHGPVTRWSCSSGPSASAVCSGTGSRSSSSRSRCSTGASSRWLLRGRGSRTRVTVGGLGAPRAPGAARAPLGPTPRRSAPSALRDKFDAVVLAAGSTPLGTDLEVPGRELGGVHFAMDYLKSANLVVEGVLGAFAHRRRRQARRYRRRRRHRRRLPRDRPSPGGGLGRPARGILPMPGPQRGANNPWPTWPLIYRTSFGSRGGR